MTKDIILFSSQEWNTHLFDPWTFSHINLNIILACLFHDYLREKTFIYVFIFNVVFEIFEQSFLGKSFFQLLDSSNKVNELYAGDAYMNIIGDLIADVLGICIGIWIAKHYKNHKYKLLILSTVFFETVMYLSSSENRSDNLGHTKMNTLTYIFVGAMRLLNSRRHNKNKE